MGVAAGHPRTTSGITAKKAIIRSIQNTKELSPYKNI
jgi:hypothetical protein